MAEQKLHPEDRVVQIQLRKNWITDWIVKNKMGIRNFLTQSRKEKLNVRAQSRKAAKTQCIGARGAKTQLQ